MYVVCLSRCNARASFLVQMIGKSMKHPGNLASVCARQGAHNSIPPLGVDWYPAALELGFTFR
jgi:hypothetical protein